MRVQSVTIRKLFGRLDYTITLNRDERITIIHGPNGYGKTAVLRLIDAMFNRELDELRSIPFEMIRVELDGDTYLAVHRDDENASDHTERLRDRRRSSSLGPTALADVFGDLAPKHLTRLTYSIGTGDHELIRYEVEADFEGDSWIKRQTLKLVNEALALARGASSHQGNKFAHLLNALREVGIEDSEKLFIFFLLTQVPVRLITIQRLLVPSEASRFHVKERGQSFESAVEVYSREFDESVQETQLLYTQKAQQLDRTFPQRVMQEAVEPEHTDESLKQELTDLENRRAHLAAIGIPPNDDTKTQSPPEPLYETTRKLLWMYARDAKEKLSVFDELAAKVQLLQTLINKRFQFKRLRIDMEHGLGFESDDGRMLPPTALSSGEQHELILLYECLFKLKPDSLLLIDEPELSLHVSWQIEFLRDLQQIIELARFDALIATHSPQIIHDRWDLTLDLQELYQLQRSSDSPDSHEQDVAAETAGSPQ